MSKSSLLALALVFPIVVLGIWTARIDYKIKKAPEITIRAEGYDPRNLISGHYLNLRLNWQETDCSQFSDNLCHPSRFKSIYNYYLPEYAAQELDRIILKEKLAIDLVFAYPQNKQPHLKRLLINGQKWKKWLKKRNKKAAE